VKTEATRAMTAIRQCIPGDVLVKWVTATCFSHAGRVNIGCIETMVELIPLGHEFYDKPTNLSRVLKQCAVVANRVKNADLLHGCFTLVKELFRRDGVAFKQALALIESKYAAKIGVLVASNDEALMVAMRSSLMDAENTPDEATAVGGAEGVQVDAHVKHEEAVLMKASPDTLDVAQDVASSVVISSSASPSALSVASCGSAAFGTETTAAVAAAATGLLEKPIESHVDVTVNLTTGATPDYNNPTALSVRDKSNDTNNIFIVPAAVTADTADENRTAGFSNFGVIAEPQRLSVTERINTVIAASKVSVPALADGNASLPLPLLLSGRRTSSPTKMFEFAVPTVVATDQTVVGVTTNSTNQPKQALSGTTTDHTGAENESSHSNVRVNDNVNGQQEKQRVDAVGRVLPKAMVMPLAVKVGEAQRLFSTPLSPSTMQGNWWQSHAEPKVTAGAAANTNSGAATQERDHLVPTTPPTKKASSSSSPSPTSQPGSGNQPVLQHVQPPGSQPVATPDVRTERAPVLGSSPPRDTGPFVAVVATAAACGGVEVPTTVRSRNAIISAPVRPSPAQTTTAVATTEVSPRSLDEPVVEPVAAERTSTPQLQRRGAGQVSQRIAFYESSASPTPTAAVFAPVSDASVCCATRKAKAPQVAASPDTPQSACPTAVDVSTFIDGLENASAPARQHALEKINQYVLRGNSSQTQQSKLQHEHRPADITTTATRSVAGGVVFDRVTSLLDDRNIGVRRAAAYCAASLLDRFCGVDDAAGPTAGPTAAAPPAGTEAEEFKTQGDDVDDVRSLFEAMEYRHQRLVVSCSNDTSSQWFPVSVAGTLVLRRV
jgi:hypothetical protein